MQRLDVLLQPLYTHAVADANSHTEAVLAQEIERKFLVRDESWRAAASPRTVRQGYLPAAAGRTIRVRIAGDRAFLTIKGPTDGITRSEYEYAIPVADAREMLDELCEKPIIEKTRYRLDVDGLVWEIDEFSGVNAGLILAEVELDTADQKIHLPKWIDHEVSDDPRYYNRNLGIHPYSEWGAK